MAVIEISHPHLEELVGTELSAERLEEEGSMLGVLFEDTVEDRIEVEVEPNRPDLLSVEGLARALRGFFRIDTGAVTYPVQDGEFTVESDDAIGEVRPHIACARVRDLDLDEATLNSIIQLQEKLTETYGRKRAKVAIGLHDAEPLATDIRYEATDPEETGFVPLGHDEEMTMAEILDRHDKGQEYGWIVEEYDRYPLLVDSAGTVLSFPPVINGVATEVDEDTDDILLDVTGTSRDEVRTALAIVVAALHERGGTIEAVAVDGERMPDMRGDTVRLDPDYVRRISGLGDLSASGIADELAAMNHDAAVDGDEVVVEVPAYRADVMHPYDLIEDVVIGYGYDDVQPELPDVSTVGGLSDARVFTDRVREHMVGTGAQETMTFVLSNREKLFGKMAVDEEDVVAMANPLTEEYAVVRNWLLPSLMEVLGDNQHNRYPQRLFEVGRVAEPADTATGSRDYPRLAYVTAHREASFDEVRGVLQSLMHVLEIDLDVAETEHGSFAEGRCGEVVVDGVAVGIIGELSESVRENWGVGVPVAGFDIDIDAVRDLR